MPQGLWRADPAPQQRAPSAPIPAQGQQPPRAATQVATALAIVAMAWWPAPGDPRPVQPRQVRLPSAPIPVQGQQPPPVGGLQLEDVIITRASWAESGEPRLTPQRAVSFAPLTAVTLIAAQPLVVAPVIPTGSSWTPPSPVRIAPLIPVVASVPVAIVSPVALLAWRAEGNVPLVARLGLVPAALVATPAGLPLSRAVLASWQGVDRAMPARPPIAPLTLTYGQQPPVRGVMPPRMVVRMASAWPDVWWSAQASKPAAAFAGSVLVAPAQPYAYPSWLTWLVAQSAAWFGPPALVQIAAVVPPDVPVPSSPTPEPKRFYRHRSGASRDIRLT